MPYNAKEQSLQKLPRTRPIYASRQDEDDFEKENEKWARFDQTNRRTSTEPIQWHTYVYAKIGSGWFWAKKKPPKIRDKSASEPQHVFRRSEAITKHDRPTWPPSMQVTAPAYFSKKNPQNKTDKTPAGNNTAVIFGEAGQRRGIAPTLLSSGRCQDHETFFEKNRKDRESASVITKTAARFWAK